MVFHPAGLLQHSWEQLVVLVFCPPEQLGLFSALSGKLVENSYCVLGSFSGLCTECLCFEK